MTGPPLCDAAALAEEVLRDARKSGAARCLLLDVDGTLAPIAPTPEQASVPATTLELLGRLAEGGWRLVLVSGRPAIEVRAMVPVSGVHVFGSHGAEGRLDTEDQSVDLPGELTRRIGRLGREALKRVEACAGARVEIKPAGVAFHDRLVADTDLTAWRNSLRAWLAGSDLEGLEVLEGHRVLEIRPVGLHKGGVVRRLLRFLELGGRVDRSFVAVGDDETDEDMFRAIAENGLGIRVAATDVRSAATRRLESTGAVATFLERLSRG